MINIAHMTLKTGVFISSILFSVNIYAQESQLCKSIDYNDVVKTVSKHFIKRMLDSHINELGTNNPELVFDKNDVKVTSVYSIAFKAIGKTKNKSYIAIYPCDTKRIEYSIIY